jgi:hypothetical protein
VAGIARSIEERYPGHALDGSGQLVDDFGASALAEVGYRLDELGHVTSGYNRPPTAIRRQKPLSIRYEQLYRGTGSMRLVA